MRGFVLGLLVAGILFGGYLYWKQHGQGTKTAVMTAPDAGAAPREKRKKRRRGAARVVAGIERAGEGSFASPSSVTEEYGSDPFAAKGPRGRPPPEPELEPEPVKLSASDLRLVGQGDDLSRPDVMRMDLSNDSGSRELGQDEIDSRFRAREEAILDCISRARPDPESYVPGRVTVKFRIQRSGTVRGVRVEAPAILQKGGLYGCVKGVVGALRFPPSSGSQIVSYPFSLS